MRSHEMSRDAHVVLGWDSRCYHIYPTISIHTPHKGCKPTYTITTITTTVTTSDIGYQVVRGTAQHEIDDPKHHLGGHPRRAILRGDI